MPSPKFPVEEYRRARSDELQILFEQRQFIGFIAKHMPMVNLTVLNKFATDHIKGGQIRLWALRFTFYGKWNKPGA